MGWGLAPVAAQACVPWGDTCLRSYSGFSASQVAQAAGPAEEFPADSTRQRWFCFVFYSNAGGVPGFTDMLKYLYIMGIKLLNRSWTWVPPSRYPPGRGSQTQMEG